MRRPPLALFALLLLAVAICACGPSIGGGTPARAPLATQWFERAKAGYRNADFEDAGEAVKRALGELTDREQEVVRLRFGLDDGRIRTLEEVGQIFGVTRERIRQIEMKTLAKLRHPQVSRPLRDYVEGD